MCLMAFLTTLLFTVLTVTSALASDSEDKKCFDFSTKIVNPLKAAPSTFSETQDSSQSENGKELDWAKIAGVVKKPITELYLYLLDPHTIRNNSNTQIRLKEIPSDQYMKRFEQLITVKPIFFLTLDWAEIWTFALKEGTKEAPKSIVVSYEKVSGTSHIQHLCGNIVLQQLSPKTTGVFLYEELKADQRDSKDVLNGITGTLKTLRDKPSSSP